MTDNKMRLSRLAKKKRDRTAATKGFICVGDQVIHNDELFEVAQVLEIGRQPSLSAYRVRKGKTFKNTLVYIGKEYTFFGAAA